MRRIVAAALVAGCSYSPGVVMHDAAGGDGDSDAPLDDSGSPIDVMMTIDGAMPPPDMVMVPAGAFMRGCNTAVDTQCETDESPYRSITLSAFSIDRTEVTFAAWSACVTAAVCTAAANPGASNRPVSVTRAQAEVYCGFVGKRLPTEAEWEKAARGTDGRKYPWGNSGLDCMHANIAGCGGVVMAVGSLPAGVGPYGAVDMLGNVWEWVSDSYDGTYYQTAPATNPPGPAPNDMAIRRGGGTLSDTIGARVSNRGWNVPGAGDHGVRCVK
ncbi:MAG TPA: SUMF1/EgtB/PvdO family nonheme iron enzyme [Kofleriaceae bacterium]